MPCRDWEDVTAAEERAMRVASSVGKERERLKKEIAEQKKTIDKMSVFLCAICDYVGERHLEGDLLEWYRNHKQGDNKEADRVRALEATKEQLEARVESLTKELAKETKEAIYKASLLKGR